MADKGVLSLDVSMQPGDGMLADHGVEMSRIRLGEADLDERQNWKLRPGLRPGAAAQAGIGVALWYTLKTRINSLAAHRGAKTGCSECNPR